jgi:hypothetical protein
MDDKNYHAQHYLKNKERYKINSKKNYNKRKDELTEKNRIRRITEKDYFKQRAKEYRIKNKAKEIEKHNNKLKTDLLYAIKYKLRVSVAFKRIKQTKPANTEQLLGCTWIEAKEHFEKLFKPGMNWSNHGDWHIDHIKPVAAFTKDDIHLMNHISNLQPLWAIENLIKGDKY